MAAGSVTNIAYSWVEIIGMARKLILFTGILFYSFCFSRASAAEKVTLENLLRQMTDLSLLAEFPDPPYVTKQFSSYDRASEAPGNPSWFANDDHGFMLYDGVVKEKTMYFKSLTGLKAAEGSFPAGTKVGIAPNHRPQGDYVWAYATGPDGGALDGRIPQGWIPKSSITMEKQGHVLAEMDGPGCVVRIWSPNPQNAGNIRIYLDGNPQPVIEAPMEKLLNGSWATAKPGAPGEQWIPFSDPKACERSHGWNLYFPIPYAKHCKIFTDKQDIYYHVDYRTYPKGTALETFNLGLLAEKAGLVAEVTNHLARDDLNQPALSRAQDANAFTLQPGGVFQVHSPPMDMHALYSISIQIRSRKSVAEALRSVVLIGAFDRPAIPQIWCPLGDFFASAPGFNSYKSLPFALKAIDETKVRGPKGNGDKKDVVELSSRWWMPFKSEATIGIRNMGTNPVEVLSFLVRFAPYNWTDRSMHFHAKWRTEKLKTRPFCDWNFCDLKGQGVFVGDMLSVMNPVPAWWGEGDEKIYVDGEKFPSWFGTGTEDYFGYGWADPKPFQHAYHNQTRCDGPANKGHTSVNRFHILDNIPFQKSFRFDMEFWHWTPNIDVTYAATSYWYARPSATDNFREVDAKVLQNIPQPPPPMKIAGAIEGEAMKVLGKSRAFDAGPQEMGIFPDSEWSGDSQLWVRPPKKDEWIDLELPVAADGRYHVIVYLTKAQDYGIVQFHLNGKPIGKPIDCFEPNRVISTGALDLGEVELKKGKATMRVEVVGTNEMSVGSRYMWGLDCVVLKGDK
jgi:hypothetical protein